MNNQEYEHKKRECWKVYVDMLNRNCATRYMFDKIFDRAYALGKQEKDSEGEDELLAVTRSKVQELYKCFCTERDNEEKGSLNKFSLSARIAMLEELFDSKCLPDDTKDDTKEPKPAEPKFKMGDIAVVRGFKHPLLEHDGAIVSILSYHEKGDYYSCAIAPNVGIDVDAKCLEPYTEPQEDKAEEIANKAIEPVEKHFDNILKDSFRNERRLNIAAMAMQGILSNPQLLKIAIETYQEEIGSPDIYVAVAKTAKAQADALIAECEQTETDTEIIV